MKQLDHDKLPCKFANHWYEVIGEKWMGSCPMFECIYDGEIAIPDDLVCNEDNTCPAYEPVETHICSKHEEEYYDVCGKCEEEMWNPKGEQDE